MNYRRPLAALPALVALCVAASALTPQQKLLILVRRAAAPQVAPPSETLWQSSALTPAIVDANDGSAATGIELGFSFQSRVAGKVTGVKFYKGVGNTGTHIGNLWNGAGTNLGAVTFTGETASGWQSMNFATPITIAANTTYVVSYHLANTHYSATNTYFVAGNNYLNYDLNAAGTGNGLFSYSVGTVKPATSNLANFFVDVIFKPTTYTTPLVNASVCKPDATTTGVPTGTVKTNLTTSVAVLVNDGGLLDAWNIVGTVSVLGSNATISRNLITVATTASIVVNSGAGNTYVDNEINGVGTGNDGSNGINGGNYTALRNNIYNVENAINNGTNSTFKYNFMHALLATGVPHYDTIQMDGGQNNVLIQCNTLLNPFGQTSAVMIDNFFGAQANITVDSNYMSGGQYTQYVDASQGAGSFTNIAITNNAMVSGVSGYCNFNGTTPTASGNFNKNTLAAVCP